ncbi:MAG: sugar phosphate isomerase/epimerase [Anaerolineae bacterium]|nr:sugar phosphate isomerase/epimerase [Anaerolineae bacterium]
MNTISFMTANYVAREIGYRMTDGWMQGQEATDAYFEQPVEVFAPRFDRYMADVRGLGFDAVDIWIPILNPVWATAEHIAAAKESLARHNLKVVSLAGGFGDTREHFEKSCRLAKALDTTILGGGTGLLYSDRAFMVDTLKAHGLKFGFENHPEKNPDEMMEKVGDGGDGTIGLAVDTGWFGTYGFNAAEALETLKDYLFHVHLKDVRAPGGHETCRFGEGVVPVEACARTLKRIGYRGAIAVEHEPHDYDPSDDVRISAGMLRGWLA